MNQQLSILASILVDALDKKIIGLLHIGSNERQDDTAFSDIDLILLAEDFQIENLRTVREIVRNLEYLVDMPIIQRNQLPANPDLFQMGTHGCYFLQVLRKAQIIYGNNFLEDYPEPSAAAVQMSVFRKVAEYTWAARRIFVESNRERSTYQNYQLTSRLLKAAKDVLWLDGLHDTHLLTAAESVVSLKKSSPKLLSDYEWEVLKMISDPDIRNSLAANMSEDFLQIRMSVLDKIYNRAVILLEGRQ
jgi:hypothetical protein